MPKKRDKNPDEWLKGQNRQLAKENRHLKKRIRQLEKTEHMFEDALLNEEEIEYDETTVDRYCNECGKGKLRELNVLDRIFEECTVCDYRKKIRGPDGQKS